MQFVPTRQENQSSFSTPIPMDPVILPPVISKPLPVLSKGTCTANSSTVLTSCQKCTVPLNPPAPAQFSKKGQSLIDVMSIACSVSNKSAPKNYVPPTKTELMARLNRLSPQFYPDSVMSGFQISTIEGLKINPALQEKMFGGLWYQPPYSDAFETYFGLEVAEVVSQICYQNSNSTFTPYNSSVLMSKQMIDCTYASSNPFSCVETPAYVAANVYRNNLRAAMIQSVKNPYTTPEPKPSKICSWEKFEGLYELGGEEQLGKWLASEQKISMEITGLGGFGGQCSLVNKIPEDAELQNRNVVLSAYICK